MAAVFLRIKSLNVKSMRNVRAREQVIRVAAAHNLRELAAEFADYGEGKIDVRRTHMNYRIHGPPTAADVAHLGERLLCEAGVTWLRKDAVMALEIVISLPRKTGIEHGLFFSEAVRWAQSFFTAPMLSAVVHLDESQPHCHVLLLPLISGRMNGGRLAGGPKDLIRMHADFHEKVGKKYGLLQQERALNARERRHAASLILQAIEREPGHLGEQEVREALLDVLASNPNVLCGLLGVDVRGCHSKSRPSFVSIMTRPCSVQ